MNDKDLVEAIRVFHRHVGIHLDGLLSISPEKRKERIKYIKKMNDNSNRYIRQWLKENK